MKHRTIAIIATLAVVLGAGGAFAHEWLDHQVVYTPPVKQPTVQVEQPVTPEPVKHDYRIAIPELLAGTNAQRATPLVEDPTLDSTAAGHCAELSQSGVFDHTGWEKWLQSTGRTYYGENLSEGGRTSQAIVDGWVNSPTHYSNLVNTRFKRVGFAVCDFNDTKLVVQHFSN